MVKHITFGGIKSEDYAEMVTSPQSYRVPKRIYESIAVEGRNGELTIDKGRYSNIKIVYNFIFKDVEKMDEFKARMYALKGYQRLEDENHPGIYRMARIPEDFKPKMKGEEYDGAVVSMTFDCMPQKWLKSGEGIDATSRESRSTYLKNDTHYDAKPLIRVTGRGAVRIGGTTMTVKSHSYAYMDIDCESMEAYCGSNNLNNYLTLNSGSFPVLPAGENTAINWTDTNITAFTLKPRWWTL